MNANIAIIRKIRSYLSTKRETIYIASATTWKQKHSFQEITFKNKQIHKSQHLICLKLMTKFLSRKTVSPLIRKDKNTVFIQLNSASLNFSWFQCGVYLKSNFFFLERKHNERALKSTHFELKNIVINESKFLNYRILFSCFEYIRLSFECTDPIKENKFFRLAQTWLSLHLLHDAAFIRGRHLLE